MSWASCPMPCDEGTYFRVLKDEDEKMGGQPPRWVKPAPASLPSPVSLPAPGPETLPRLLPKSVC